MEQKGAHKVKVKYLLHAGVGAKRIQYRLFTIEKGGYTSLERHHHEHEVYILKGKGSVRGGEEEVQVGPGDVVFIPSNEQHRFRNISYEPLQMLCTKETSEIPTLILQDMNRDSQRS